MQIFGRTNLKIVSIVCVLLLAIFLRLWRLEILPVGFTPDEASFGYDAYSILHTGKDQWGHFLPVTLESFGDYKSPLYSYLAIPTIAIFGLNEFATRLPNAIIGALAVFVVFLLLGEIGKLLKLEEKRKSLLQISGALFLAVSSWQVMMSRGAFEANLVTFFIPLGVYLFLRAVGSSQYTKYYLLSTVSFGLSLFTYHSAKFLTPIIFIGLIFIFWKKIKNNWKKFVFPMAIFLVFFSILLYSFKVGGGTRIVERSITQGALDEGARIKIQLIQDGANPILAKILHNKYQVVAQRFISNYSQYFSLDFLFTKGPAETTYGMIPGLGVLYVFEGLLLIGLVPLLVKQKSSVSVVLPLLAWLLVAPIPAALATGIGYAANRAEGMIPVFQILIALGLVGWNIYFEKKNASLLLLISFAFAVLVANNLIFAWKSYVSSATVSASGMLYGRGEAIHFVSQNIDDYQNIIVSRSISEPQIYIAFYTKYNPLDFQEASQRWGIYKDYKLSFLDQLGEYSLGKYIFKNIDYKKDVYTSRTLLLGKPSEFPAGANIIKEIVYPDGVSDIFIVKP